MLHNLSTGTGTNLSTSNLFTLLFKLFKAVGTFFNLLIPYLSTLDFKLAKSTFLANFDVSAHDVVFPFITFFIYYIFNSKLFLICFLQFFFLIFQQFLPH